MKTDCSINWTAPDGKVYCFALETSKEAFLKNPAGVWTQVPRYSFDGMDFDVTN